MPHSAGPDPVAAAPALELGSAPLEGAGPAVGSDAELMRRVAGGDREAFARLVERHKDALVDYLRRMSGDAEQARDLAQETFLRMYRAAPRYREQGRLRGWLFRIGANLLRSAERRRRIVRWVPLAGTGAANRQALHAAPTGEPATRLALEQAVAELPLRLREPLVLRLVEGWSVTEIARHLGVAEGTVKSRVSRGRSALKQRLAPLAREDNR